MEELRRYAELLGSWKGEHLIGEGSFGKVYALKKTDFGKDYYSALKIITIPQTKSEITSLQSEGMNDASIKAHFEQFAADVVSEFDLMSRLRGNSNIVSYEDHMIMPHEDGYGYDILIRMELLTSLVNRLRENQFTKKDIIKLGIDICKALELCQKHNIIHRDIKPENIFVSDNGDYKLGDFGIARTVEKTVGEMSKKGTYTYMAPEVYKGEEYGSGVDLYSLGVVMYRLLNGNRTPFLPAHPAPISHNDRDSALLRRMKGEKIPPPTDSEGRLTEIVMKSIEYNANDRFVSPMQMRQELEVILYTEGEGQIIYPKGDGVAIHSNLYTDGKGNEQPQAAVPVQPVAEDRTAYAGDMTVFSSEDMTVADMTVAEPMVMQMGKPAIVAKKKFNMQYIYIAAAVVCVLGVGVLALILSGIIGGSSEESSDGDSIEVSSETVVNSRGNTTGNISNNALVASQGEWIYYCDISDDQKLYKVKTDGTGKTKLSNDMSSYVNVIGDWIYYLSIDGDIGIYKIKTDGTEKTRIGEEAMGVYLNVIGGWIYYSEWSDEKGNLYKMKTDGTDRTKLNDDQSDYINVVGDRVYYINQSDGNKLYKINTDGADRTKLNDDNCYAINVSDDWIYYINVVDYDYNPYKIRTDGSDRTKLSDDDCYELNVSDGWIYYAKGGEENGITPFKMRTDGADKTKMTEDSSSSLFIAGDWLYYTFWDDNFENGELRKVLKNEPVQQVLQTAPTTNQPTEPPTPPPTEPPTPAPTEPPTPPPTTQPTTQKPTPAPTTQPTTQKPTPAPTTQPTTPKPTPAPTTQAPTTQRPTPAPTTQPTTQPPNDTVTNRDFTWVNASGYSYPGRYTGDWKDGKPHGKGTFSADNGDKYVGDWKNGKMDGYGTYTTSGGSYVGQIKDNKADGKGTMKWKNGDKYEGDWKNDMFHGHGTYTYANGEKYEGEWKNDDPTGWFMVTLPDGTMFQLEY